MRRKMLGMMWGGSPPIMILCWKEIGGVSTSCHFVRRMSHLWCPILLKHYTTLIFFSRHCVGALNWILPTTIECKYMNHKLNISISKCFSDQHPSRTFKTISLQYCSWTLQSNWLLNITFAGMSTHACKDISCYLAT